MKKLILSVFLILGAAAEARLARAQEVVGDDDVVRVETSLVTVPVSVFDRNGKFIPGLLKEDFRVYEDGVEQRVVHFEPVERAFTVLLMLDTSQSTVFRLKDMQDAAVAFVDQLRPDDRVVVIAFSNVLSVMNEPTADRRVLYEAIRRTHAGGGTSLYPAIDHVINRRLKDLPGRKALVLFTDGADTGAARSPLAGPRATFESTLQDAEEADLLIYPIQYHTLEYMLRKYGKEHHEHIRKSYARADEYLLKLAWKTGGRHYRADTLPKLSAAFSQIAEELRRQYSLGYYPQGDATQGVRRHITVRVRRPDLVVRARSGYVRDH